MGDRKLRKILPNMMECPLDFDEMKSFRDIILYTLWCSGELSYYKLLLISKIDMVSLDAELQNLIDSNDISMIKLGDSVECFTNNFTSISFRINRSV